MVDSGSMVTVISERALRKLEKRPMHPCTVRINNFSHNPIETVGVTNITLFSNSNHPITVTVVVVPEHCMEEDMVLGIDCLSKRPFFLDYNRDVFLWNNISYPMKKSGPSEMCNIKVSLSKPYSTSLVKLPENTRIKPGELVMASFPSFFPGTYIISAVPVKIHNGKSLLMGKEIVVDTNEDGTLFLPIWNETHHTIKLRKGTVIGKRELYPGTFTALDLQGKVLGTHTEVLDRLCDRLTHPTVVPMCANHNYIFSKSLPQRLETRPSEIWNCQVCLGSSVKIANLKETIVNEMIPPDTPVSELENMSREEKLKKLIPTLDLKNIKGDLKKEMEQLLLKHHQLFILEKSEMGLIQVPDHHIPLIDQNPVRMPLYRHPERAKEIIQKMITEMLEKEVIEPSYALYLSPIVLVTKPDGSKRMCIDYRGVNQKIKMDIHPLPRLDELLDDVSGHSWYCTLDLKDAYYQCQLDERSRDITTFSDGINLYRFKRLPFGLSVAPAIFTRAMQEVLRPLSKLGFVKNYLDDVILFAPNAKTLLERLDMLFKRMQEMGLKLNVMKCQLFQKKIKFLGHYVSQKGLEVNPTSVEAIQKLTPPTSTKEVRRFIGMCSFYRKFIHNFAKIASPITSLQSKLKKFVWTPECQLAFLELKRLLTVTPVLTKADLSKPFELHTDASKCHVGAVLMQREENGLHPLGYFSKKLNRCEQRYGATEREALAIVKASRFFYHYLWGKKFLVVTDHEPLTHIFKKRPKTSRMCRFRLDMKDFSYDVQYKKGIEHRVPDALSRPFPKTSNLFLPPPMLEAKYPGFTSEEVIKEQKKDPQICKIISYCNGGNVPKRSLGNRTLSCFELIEGILYMRREEFHRIVMCLVIPKGLRALACHLIHNDSHFGIHKTVKKAQQLFYWPSLWKDVTNFVKSCHTCQQFKKEGGLKQTWKELPSVDNKGKRIAIDLIDMVDGKGGYRYCLTVMDHFSRFIRAYPLRNKSAGVVLRALRKDVCVFGTPETILMDNGSEFTNREFKTYCSRLGITQAYCMPYHPRGNSVLERAHRTLKSVLGTLSREHPNQWPDKLSETLKALNEAVHTSLGTSPYFVQFGYHPLRKVGQVILPELNVGSTDPFGALSEEVRKQIWRTQKEQTHHYRTTANKKRKDISLTVGDLAWVNQETPIPGTATKLNKRWNGPYRIDKVIDGGRAYVLASLFDNTNLKRAAEKVKRYYARDEILKTVKEEYHEIEEEEEKETEELGKRTRRPPDRYCPGT